MSDKTSDKSLEELLRSVGPLDMDREIGPGDGQAGNKSRN